MSQTRSPSTFKRIYQKLTGNDLGNSHIPMDRGVGQVFQTYFKKRGVSSLVHEKMQLAKDHDGIAATWLALFPVFCITNPSLIQQLLKINRKMLSDVETGGVQERLFAKDAKLKTIIALPSTHPEYKLHRGSAMHHLFNRIADLASPMQKVIDAYEKELESKEVDLEDVTSRIAMTMISQIQLGFDVYYDEKTEAPQHGEMRKSKIAKVVHKIVEMIPNPLVGSLMDLENSFQRNLGFMPKLCRSLWPLETEGENLIKEVIKLNEGKVKASMQSLLGSTLKGKELKIEDLCGPDVMSVIKLYLIGGFETTSKLLMYSIVEAANPKNKDFVNAMREQIASYGKKPEDLTAADLEELPYLKFWILEVLRMYPPFSYMRFTAHEDVTLHRIPVFNDEKQYEALNAEAKEKLAISNAELKVLLMQKRMFEKELSRVLTVKEAKDLEVNIFDINKKIKEISHIIETQKPIVIPKGAFIATSPIDAHRSPDLYGENAGVFDPRRWEQKCQEGFSLRSVMSNYDFFTLGNDPRACPGRMFSAQEAMLTMARIIMNYDVTLVTKPPKLDPGFTLELQEGQMVKAVFSKRQAADLTPTPLHFAKNAK